MSTTSETWEASSPAAIWGRIVGADRPNYSPETARAILQLDFAPEDHRRMAELSARIGGGSPEFSASGREVLGRYVEINDILILLQSKARLSLKRAGIQP